MGKRQYVKGGSPNCACGKPRRKHGFRCLDCHSMFMRIRRAQGPRTKPKVPQPRAPRPAAHRVRVVQPRPRIDIRARLAPIWKRLMRIMDYADGYKPSWELACSLDRQILPLVHPLGIGYHYRWQTRHVPHHLLFNLLNRINHIKIK